MIHLVQRRDTFENVINMIREIEEDWQAERSVESHKHVFPECLYNPRISFQPTYDPSAQQPVRVEITHFIAQHLEDLMTTNNMQWNMPDRLVFSSSVGRVSFRRVNNSQF